jgi:hypothetical protein
MTRFDRFRVSALWNLLAVLFLLILAALYTRGLTLSFLADHKDGFAALNNVVGTAALGIGGVLAYFRFFRGRTFATRANLQVEVEVACSPSGRSLHSIRIEVANVGTTTLVDPTMEITAVRHHINSSTSDAAVEVWRPRLPKDTRKRAFYSVEPGETAVYFAQEPHAPEVWLVSYEVTFSLPNGRTWTDYVAVENKSSNAGDPSTSVRRSSASAQATSP